MRAYNGVLEWEGKELIRCNLQLVGLQSGGGCSICAHKKNVYKKSSRRMCVAFIAVVVAINWYFFLSGAVHLLTAAFDKSRKCPFAVCSSIHFVLYVAEKMPTFLILVVSRIDGVPSRSQGTFLRR